jgi:alkylation response protein AidB-like acyl-CoA dehydrogenase
MTFVDIDTGVSPAEKAVVEVAHRFAAETLRPIGVKLDRLPDPAAVSAPGSPLYDVFRQERELGLGYFSGATDELPPAARARLRAAVSEELGWGDAGLAISLGAGGFHRYFAMLSGRPALIERYARPDDDQIGCWAITEPDHGSDTLAFSEPHFSNPSLRANCVARREGDDYVIRGQKSSWVSNGTIAHVAALFCTMDTSHGLRGGGVALVPLDLPGVSRGKPLDKLGQRALNQGPIFFDNVRLPAEYMIVEEETYAPAVESVLTLANAGMGTTFVGVARAAFEHALAYAKERVQGGVPIIQHQSVKGRLFDMFTQVEAARALARRVAVFNSTEPTPMLHYSIASKVFCTNTAFETATAALQIFGGNGLTREYPLEKLLRDARASQIEDGCNFLLGLVGASKL